MSFQFNFFGGADQSKLFKLNADREDPPFWVENIDDFSVFGKRRVEFSVWFFDRSRLECQNEAFQFLLRKVYDL